MNLYAKMIPPKAKTVVEFGCGNGDTGRWFKRIRPDCRYIGVDEDDALLQQAESHLDGVIRGAVDDIDLRAGGISQADCFVYRSSYLKSRHLKQRLAEHASLLASGGQMIFLLDHGGYFRRFMQNLLDGSDAPAQAGPAKEELLQILPQIGMSQDGIGTLAVPEDEKLRENPDLMAACDRYCKARNIAMGPDLWVKQYVVRAVKGPHPGPLALRVLLGDPVCASMRVWIPDQCCMTSPGVDIEEMEIPEGKEYVPPNGSAGRHVFIYQRFVFGDLPWGISWLRMLRERRSLVLCEIDDCPKRWDHIFSDHRYLEFVGCHAIQTSTEPLAEYLRQYNPHVAVFENQLELLPERQAPPPEGAPVTVFFGALNRTEDWQEIMPALNDAIQLHGRGIRFLVCADRAFFDALRTEEKEYVGGEYNEGRFAPYELYAEALQRSDIALLPLKDNLFNRMKSDLKFIEAAAYGAVALASPTVYERTLRDGATGFLYRDPREFRERLSLLVENRALRLALADAAYGYVKRHRLIAQHYEERIHAYREMLSRWGELERECRERVDALHLHQMSARR